MTDTGSELVSRKQFLEEFEISDSGERRGRTGQRDWPPHVRIGKKKIYYRRAALDDWIRRQEVLCNSAPPEAPSPESLAIRPRGKRDE
jgi:hypothetical protein